MIKADKFGFEEILSGVVIKEGVNPAEEGQVAKNKVRRKKREG
jgi:hypothetical protein